MKKLITLSAMALLAVAGTSLAQDTTKVDKYAFPPLPQELKHADSLLIVGDSTNGLARLRLIITETKDNELAARALFQIGEYYSKDIKKVISRELALKKKSAINAKSKKEALLWSIKKESEYKILAHDQYIRAYTEYPNSKIKPWAMLAAAYAVSGDDKIAILEKMTKEYIGSSIGREAQSSIASEYQFTHDLENAKREWQKLINEYPEDHWYCAEAMYNIGQYTEGDAKLNIFENLIDHYPDQEHWTLMAITGKAIYYEMKGDKRKALGIELSAVDKYPHHGSAPLRLANIMFDFQKLGDWGESDRIKRRLLNEYPDSPEAKKNQPK